MRVAISMVWSGAIVVTARDVSSRRCPYCTRRVERLVGNCERCGTLLDGSDAVLRRLGRVGERGARTLGRRHVAILLACGLAAVAVVFLLLTPTAPQAPLPDADSSLQAVNGMARAQASALGAVLGASVARPQMSQLGFAALAIAGSLLTAWRLRLGLLVAACGAVSTVLVAFPNFRLI